MEQEVGAFKLKYLTADIVTDPDTKKDFNIKSGDNHEIFPFYMGFFTPKGKGKQFCVDYNDHPEIQVNIKEEESDKILYHLNHCHVVGYDDFDDVTVVGKDQDINQLHEQQNKKRGALIIDLKSFAQQDGHFCIQHKDAMNYAMLLYENMLNDPLYQAFGINNQYLQSKYVFFKNEDGGDRFKLCDGKTFGGGYKNDIYMTR